MEEDHSEITEEESFIQNALTMLDHRHSSEMDMLQRKMEELQRHYMQEKETLRVDLVQTLFNARKLQEGGHQGAVEGEGEGGGLSPAILQLQQQQQFIQQQIQAHLWQEQLQQQAPALAATTVYSPSPTMSLSAAGHLMQPPAALPAHQHGGGHRPQTASKGVQSGGVGCLASLAGPSVDGRGVASLE